MDSFLFGLRLCCWGGRLIDIRRDRESHSYHRGKWVWACTLALTRPHIAERIKGWGEALPVKQEKGHDSEGMFTGGFPTFPTSHSGPPLPSTKRRLPTSGCSPREVQQELDSMRWGANAAWHPHNVSHLERGQRAEADIESKIQGPCT